MEYLYPTHRLDLDMSGCSFIDNAMTPTSSSRAMRLGFRWALDNGAFTNKFNESKFYKQLELRKEYIGTCIFIVAPDVLRDAEGTHYAFLKHQPRIKAMGYPVALVAQDGYEDFFIPVETHRPDYLFIGGSTEWKVGNGAASCIAQAKKHGIKVHIGRVNSAKRYDKFLALGADSCDGTFMAIAPHYNFKRMQKWFKQLQLPLGA